MKNLTLASVLVAAAGLLCFGILTLLHLPDQVPAYLSSVMVGALPMVHQELEKRTGQRALVSPAWTPATQPPSASTTPYYPPGFGPPETPSGIDSAASQHQYHIATIGSSQPNPVYIPLAEQSPHFQQGQPVPVYNSLGRAAIARHKTFSIRWQVMLVYGVALVTALRQFSGLLSVLFVLQSSDPMSDFIIINFLMLLFVDTVIIFFIGRWIGRRADTNTFQTVLGMTALGLLAAFVLDFVFAPEVATEAGVAGYLQGFVFQMIILCPCALAGWWLGRRSRPAFAA